jgi:hypothetical protein
MKIECETKKIDKERRIVLNDGILKKPNFRVLKKMLGLGDDVCGVDIYFNKYEVYREVFKK